MTLASFETAGSACRNAQDIARILIRQRKPSPGNNRGFRTDRNRSDRSGQCILGGSRRIQRSVGVQPRKATTRLAGDRAEIASNNDFAVRLHGKREHASIYAEVRLPTKGFIHLAARMEASEILDLPSTRLREGASHNDVATGLDDQRVHLSINSIRLRKRAIQRPVVIQSRNVVAHNPVDRAKAAADHDLSIGLNNDCEHLAVYPLACAKSRRECNLILRMHHTDRHCQH